MTNCFHCGCEVVVFLEIQKPDFIAEICPQCNDMFFCALDGVQGWEDMRYIEEQLQACREVKKWFYASVDAWARDYD